MPNVEIRLCSSGVVSIVVTFDRMSASSSLSDLVGREEFVEDGRRSAE
jgi:hypothetical protein